MKVNHIPKCNNTKCQIYCDNGMSECKGKSVRRPGLELPSMYVIVRHDHDHILWYTSPQFVLPTVSSLSIS